MNKVIYISGGARSGKSSYAQNMAKSLSNNPVYVATARNWDSNFNERIKRHQADRDDSWINFEEELYPSTLNIENKVVLIDCATLWLTNFFTDYNQDIDKCLEAFKSEFDKLKAIPSTLIIVSNEIGMGVHSSTEIGRKFTDLQGWINQFIAKSSDEAYLMISGLPLKLK